MTSKSFIIAFKNYWKEKPLWCQPWSIIITGFFFVLLSWFVFKKLILSLIVLFLVGVWWLLFLFVAPSTYIDSYSFVDESSIHPD